MKYTYFVSYVSNGWFGMIEFFSNTTIETFDDVLTMTESISKHKGEEIIVVNWKLLNG